MAKYAGMVGFAVTTETAPGVWTDEVAEHKMRGDVIGDGISGRFNQGESINDDFSLSHRVSLIGDPFSFENLAGIRYVTYMGVKWIVTGLQIERPRLIVNLGGVYSGES